MCGISGCLEFVPDSTPDADALRRMTDFMTHRGPDDAGYWVEGPMGLGHRRLSIIDLSEGGHQPKASRCGRYVIAFNGEIYNYIELRERLKGLGHEFETTSDTEVLLRACIQWGEDAPTHLNGMFAFGFWDRQERTLLLARDHLGIKPLYYYRDERRLLFASDVGAIAAHPGCVRRLNHKALSHFFTWRVVPCPDTIFEDMHQLPPGCTLRIDAQGRSRQKRYWDIPVAAGVSRMKPEAAEARLTELLEDALRLQVRSDVPVGAFLSGGVDSSTVAYWMSKAVGGGLSFTIGFQGEERDFDESEWAADVAQHIGTEHHLHMLERYDIVPLMERIAWMYGQPCGTGVPNYFVSAMARRHVKVALAGVGGDECFAGYGRFQAARSPLKMGYKSTDPVYCFLRSLVSFTEDDKRRFFTGEFYDMVRDEPSLEKQREMSAHVRTRNTLDRLCYIDLTHFMLNDLLFNLDKMSMAHSLEVRVPLLDYRIVEFAMQVPPVLKVIHGEHKVLLKRAMYRRLPKHVFLRAKRGFSLPKQVWLKQIEEFVRSLINERTVAARGLFEWPEVEVYLNNIFGEDGRASWRDANNLWNLFSFELWARQFLDSAPEITPPGGFADHLSFDREQDESHARLPVGH